MMLKGTIDLRCYYLFSSLSYKHWAFLVGVARRRGCVCVCVFSTPFLTPLSLKLDYSNFVQNYFGIR